MKKSFKIFSFLIWSETSFIGIWEVTLAVQKLSITLNSQKKLSIFSFLAIKCNSSDYLLPPNFKLVLLKGAKLIAWILFSWANSKAKFKADKTLSPASLEHSDKL